MDSAKQYNLWGSEVQLTLPSLPSDAKMKEMDDDTRNPNHFYFQTPHGKLHYRQFLPSASNPDSGDSTNIKAVCVWQHGIATHSGACVNLTNCNKNDDSDNDNGSDRDHSYPYTNVGLLSRKLTSNQIALYTLDMLGHGFSEGKRFYIPGGDFTINRGHLESFATFVAAQHPDVPFFLMGDSYGGSLALQVARMWQDQESRSNDNSHTDGNVTIPTNPTIHPPEHFRGICINAPAIIGDLPILPIRLFLQYVVAPIFPERTPFFMPHPISPDRIWRDARVRERHTSEEVRAMRLSSGASPFCLGTAAGLIKGLAFVREHVIPGFKVPFSVCHGTNDWGVKIEGTEFLIEHCLTKEEDRRVKLIPGAYHDLLGDPTREDTVDFHIQFILSRS